MLAWLSVWSEEQTCIWPSWCHCHSLSLASVKSRLVLPFWYIPAHLGSPGKRAIKRVWWWCIEQEGWRHSPYRCRCYRVPSGVQVCYFGSTLWGLAGQCQRRPTVRTMSKNTSRIIGPYTVCSSVTACHCTRCMMHADSVGLHGT